MHDYPHYKYRPRRRKKEKTSDKSKISHVKHPKTQVVTPYPSPCTSQEQEVYPSHDYNSPHSSTQTYYLPTPDVSPTEPCHDINYYGTKFDLKL